MAKEYTFQEVHQRIKPGQTYECTADDYNVKKIQMDSEGFIKVYQECHYNEVVIAPHARYRLIQKPVSFMEAVASGRRIRCAGDYRYFKTNELFLIFGDLSQKEAIEVIQGEWFIEED